MKLINFTKLLVTITQAQSSSVSRRGSVFCRSYGESLRRRVWGWVAVDCDALDWKSRAPRVEVLRLEVIMATVSL